MRDLRFMRVAFVLLLVLHGAIHLLGFVKGLGLAKVAQLQQPISRTGGLLWLLAAALLLAAAGLFAASSRFWWVAAAPGVLLSQALILLAWSDAKAGTIANVIAVLPIVVALLDLRSGSFPSVFAREVDRGLARAAPAALVTDADLASLPPPVQTYLRRVGVVGKPRVHDMRVHFRGEMRNGRDAGWMTIDVEQRSFFDQPTRLFLLHASLHGIPFEGLHAYVGPSASMRVTVAGLVDVVDAKGPEMFRSETVTFLNDMCLLAPATLLDPAITWKQVDAKTVIATLTNQGQTVSAELTFDEQGDLVGFVSKDRLQSSDGKTFKSYPWSTPAGQYKDFGAARISSYAEAIWLDPGGDLLYARFRVVELEYNLAAR